MREEVGAEDREATLAARLAGGDPRAPEEFVRAHYDGLYRYARAMLKTRETAEDAVQEAFARAFDALGGYPEERIKAMSLRPWMFRITLNVVRNAARDASRREVAVGDAPERPSPATDHDSVMDLIDALDELPERQRVAVALRHMQDLTYAEAAAATGWPENTVKTLVRRGVERLRKTLEIREAR